MFRIQYPMTMIGRRATGKTTLISVLKGKGGFKSNESKIDYHFNTSDEVTGKNLQNILGHFHGKNKYFGHHHPLQ